MENKEEISMNYTINHVINDRELDRILTFAQWVFGINKPDRLESGFAVERLHHRD